MSDPFVEYLQEPDRRRLSRFIVAYTEPVTRLVRRVVRCPETSRDVVQEVFLRLAESELRAAEVPHPRAYVFRAALNTARSHLRNEKVRAYHEQEAGRLKTRASPSAAEEVTDREAVERLYRAIDSLPEPQRVAIHLRAVDGLSYKEIALITGLPLGTVGVRIREAREELRRLTSDRAFLVAWANLEVARKHGWFPAETDGLSRAALTRLRNAAGRSRTATGHVCHSSTITTILVAVVSLTVLGLLPSRVSETGRDAPERSSAVTRPPGNRSVRVIGHSTPTVVTRETVEKPMAPVVPGAASESTRASGVETAPGNPVKASRRKGKGGQIMYSSRKTLAAAVLAMGLAAPAGGAETGDFDGDGRLSLRDYFHFENGQDPAPGSLEGFGVHPCSSLENLQWSDSSVRNFIEYALLVESFRRNVAGPLPHFYDIWPDGEQNEPLEPTGRGHISIEPATAPGGENDRVRIALELTLFAPARGFVLFLESDGEILRVPLWRKELEQPEQPEDWNQRRTIDNASRWNSMAWYGSPRLGEYRHPFGDLPVAVPPPAYLATGGKIVMTYGLRVSNGHVSIEYHDLEVGEHRIEIEARLPKGTRAGRHGLRVLPGSEILFLDGALEAPVIDGASELLIEREVSVGWDGGVPPLELDLQNRHVRGDIEMRLVRDDGSLPAEGEPLAAARAGEEVVVGVQFRTDVPLNYIDAHFQWPTGSLECPGGSVYLFSDPEDGTPYSSGRPGCSEGLGGFRPGRSLSTFRLRGGALHFESPTVYWYRPLEYFRPLGEWVDLAEVRLRISTSVSAGAEIPLEFKTPAVEREGFRAYLPAYVPYAQDLPCSEYEGGDFIANWTYDEVRYSNGFVRVLEGGEPPPAVPDTGLVVRLGDATGRPGDLVPVPIIASTEEPIDRLRLVVRLDDTNIRAEWLDIDATGPLTDAWVEETFPGENNGVNDPRCSNLAPNDPLRELCAQPAVPFWISYHDTSPDVVFIDIFSPELTDEPRELGRLHVRVLERGTAAVTAITATRTEIDNEGFPEQVASGAIVVGEDRTLTFSPAAEIRPATITIIGRDRTPRFLRGDSNGDGSVDLSDAVATLDFLFGGDSAATACHDAADADDSGGVDITDAIFHLGVLFGGHGGLPPPYPACGEDPTADTLPCRETCSDG